MSASELIESVIGALAVIRAIPSSDLAVQIQAQGMEVVMVSSIEVVTILVMLQSATGIDPTDRDILKGCNLQSVQNLAEFVTANRTRP